MRALNITSDISEIGVIVKNGVESDEIHYGAVESDVVKCIKVQHNRV